MTTQAVENIMLDIKNVFTNTDSKKYTDYYVRKKLAEDLLVSLGFSASNFERDFVQVPLALFFKATKDYDGYYNWLKMNYNPKNKNNSSYSGMYADLLSAAKREDKQAYNKITKDLKNNYDWTDDKISTIFKNRDKNYGTDLSRAKKK